MRWEDVNTVLMIVETKDGKYKTVRLSRPYEAMPKWFKRWLKQLNRSAGK